MREWEKSDRAARWAELRRFCLRQIVRPYALLLAFKLTYALSALYQWGLREGGWTPMWFFFTALIFRVLRLIGALLAIPEHAVAALSVLASAAAARVVVVSVCCWCCSFSCSCLSRCCAQSPRLCLSASP